MRRKQRSGQSGTAALHTVPLDRAQAGEQLSADLRVRTPVAGEPAVCASCTMNSSTHSTLRLHTASPVASSLRRAPVGICHLAAGGGHLAVFGIILDRMGCLTG